MAITTLASWIPTMDEFSDHWGLVNTDLGSEMVLQGNYNRANFIADRDALDAIMGWPGGTRILPVRSRRPFRRRATRFWNTASLP